MTSKKEIPFRSYILTNNTSEIWSARGGGTIVPFRKEKECDFDIRNIGLYSFLFLEQTII